MSRERREIEQMIERAIWVDRKLPPIRLRQPQSPLGNIVIIPDNRSLQDIAADVTERITNEDLQVWNMVMFDWMPKLDVKYRDIVLKRCGGMGWKRIAYEAHKGRTTVFRMYRSALDALEKVV